MNLSGGSNPEMQILYILLAILMLGFIITVHEFGHYLAGRLCGIGVVEFSIGMGPKLFGFKRKGILYSLRLIPLGGFCAFVGEDDETSAANAMPNQPVWKRFITIFSGPLMNFVLAFVACTVLLSCFLTAEIYPRIDEVIADSPAAACGMQVGDVVVDINGTAISYDTAGVDAMHSAIIADELTITVNRDGETIILQTAPEITEDTQTGAPIYQIGVTLGSRTYTAFEAMAESCGFMVDYTRETLQALKDLVFKGSGMDNMFGPVGIISYVSDVVASDTLYTVVNLIFALSLNVGIMNLLPLPALDGGRLIFLIIEAIRRKPVPPEKEGMVHAFGMSLLLMLVVFVTYKDIIRLVAGG